MAKNKKTIKWKRKRRMVGQERRNRQKEGRERMVRERLERREAERKRKGIDGGRFRVIVRQYCYRFFFSLFPTIVPNSIRIGIRNVADLSRTGRDSRIGEKNEKPRGEFYVGIDKPAG